MKKELKPDRITILWLSAMALAIAATSLIVTLMRSIVQ